MFDLTMFNIMEYLEKTFFTGVKNLGYCLHVCLQHLGSVKQMNMLRTPRLMTIIASFKLLSSSPFQTDTRKIGMKMRLRMN